VIARRLRALPGDDGERHDHRAARQAPTMPPASDAPVHGGCLCGAVRFELTAPLRRANLCHCSRCRKHSGGPALAQGRVPRDGFRLLAGAEHVETFRTDGFMAKAFCRRCGSSLFGGTWPDGPEVSVRLGALDDDPGIAPQYHSYVADAPSWLPVCDDGLRRFPGPPEKR
jgi:hypothetical protein